MANINDVRRVDAQLKRELDKLDAFAEAGLVESADRDAIRAAWKHYRGNTWAKALTQRDRVGVLRRSAAAAVHEGLGPLVGFDGVDAADGLVEDVRDGIDGLTGVDADGDATGRPVCPGFSANKTEEGYVGALRAFFAYLDEHGDGSYPWHEDVPYPDREERRIRPEDVLNPEDVAAIREHTEHPREEAFVEFMADTGLRAAAACQLRVDDIDLEATPPTYRFNPDGQSQKGADEHDFTTWDLHYSTMFVREWVNQRHPDPHPDAPLWPIRHGYDADDRENGAASPNAMLQKVAQAADRAGVDKPANLHGFRHACVKRLRMDDFTWDEIADVLAWSEESIGEMRTVYGPLEVDERKANIRKKRGVEVDEDDADAEPRACPFCGFEGNPAGSSLCHNCKSDLDRAARRAEDTEAMADQLEAGGVDPAFVAQFQRLRESNPELFAPVEGD